MSNLKFKAFKVLSNELHIRIFQHISIFVKYMGDPKQTDIFEMATTL